jgi:hypothetical protein
MSVTPLDAANARRPPHRRRPDQRKPCGRNGCPRRIGSRKEYCSPPCAVIGRELARLEELYRTAGDPTLGSDAWVALVEVSDAWTAFRQARGQLFKEIKERGLPCPEEPRRRVRRNRQEPGAAPLGSSGAVRTFHAL